MYMNGEVFTPRVGELFVEATIKLCPYHHSVKIMYTTDENEPTRVQAVACISGFRAFTFPLTGGLGRELHEWDIFSNTQQQGHWKPVVLAKYPLDEATLMALKALWKSEMPFPTWVMEVCELAFRDEDKERLRKLLD